MAYDQGKLGYEAAAQETILISQGLISSVSEALILKNYSEIESTVKHAIKYPNIVGVQVVNAMGIKVVDASFDLKSQKWQFLYGEQARDIPLENHHTISTKENNRIVTWMPVIPDKNLGWIRTEFSLDSVTAANKKIIIETFIVGILSIILSVFVIIYGLRKPVTEIKKATKFALNLPDNFGKILISKSTTDEVHLLVSALNKASVTLQVQDNKIKAALSEANNFRKAMDQIDAYIYMKDKDYRYIYANQPALKYFNCTLEELIGQDDSCFFSEENLQKIRSIDYKVIEQKLNTRDEIDLITINGEKRFFLEIKTPIFDAIESSEIYGLCGISYDITEQKLIEAELRIAAVAFESQEGILITDNKTNILRVNSAFSDITGYSTDEVIGKNPELFKSEKHEPSFYTLINEKITNTGAWQGEIWNRRKNGDIYPGHLTITAVKDINSSITNFVATLTDITLAKNAAEQIEMLAYFDPLTGLANRRLLLDRLHKALDKSYCNRTEGALIFLDLDNFKFLNDSLGHRFGDILLQEVACRLKACVHENDTVARLGGDEFLVILEDLENINATAQVELIANKILENLNKPYILEKYQYRSTPSIGIAFFNQAVTYKSIDEVLKQADIAMYQAKKENYNTIRFFDPAMQQAIKERLEIENALLTAIENNELVLFYQIQVNNNRQPLGAEALIRWNHPERGVISPNIFISIAEQSGYINAIGNWVLHTACHQLKKWQENSLTQDLVLSINVSATQFHQSDFINQINSAIQYYQIKPHTLKLELTESLLVNKVDDVISTMRKLKYIGIQISLDDFGTGYSSLQYLKKLPINQLKIDISFVRDIAFDANDVAIARTIIAMAETLDLNVIAEGVETNEQLEILVNNGCTNFQGYLFGKPKPIDEFETLLNTLF